MPDRRLEEHTVVVLRRPADAPSFTEEELDELQELHLAHLEGLRDRGSFWRRAVRSPGRPDAPRILRVRRPPRGGPPADGRGPDGPGPTPRGRGRRVVGAGRRSGLPPVTSFDIPLRGPAGEPVDLRRTLASHGTASLPPMLLDEVAGTLEVTVPVPGGRPRTVHIGAGRPGRARVEVRGRAPGGRAIASLTETLRRILNLEEDLSGFYAVAATDPELAWVTTGAGRMVHAPTVFEDVVKTVCTTNCSWSL